MILEVSKSKGAEFSRYEFHFKTKTHIMFLYLSKCPLINSKMRAKAHPCLY